MLTKKDALHLRKPNTAHEYRRMASMFTLNSGMLLKNNERRGDDIDNRQQEGQVVWSEEKLRKIQNFEADDLVS